MTNSINPYKLELVFKHQLYLLKHLNFLLFSIPASGNETNDAFFIKTLGSELLSVFDLHDLVVDELFMIDVKHFL